MSAAGLALRASPQLFVEGRDVSPPSQWPS
jgi:hypothetical protein